MGFKVGKNIFSSGISVVADINPSALKKLDIPDISSFTKKIDNLTPSSGTINNAVDGIPTSSIAKVEINPAAIKQLESVPGAQLYAKQANGVLSKFPKASFKGITALAAAGYLTYLVGIEGLTLEEALEKLGEVVADAVEEVVDTVVDSGVAGAVLDSIFTVVDAFMSGIFGDNWLFYGKIAIGAVVFAFIAKIFFAMKMLLGR